MSNFSTNRPAQHKTKEIPEDVQELNKRQKDDLLDFWESAPDGKARTLAEMIECAFPGQNIDGRSKQGRLVRSFLVEECNIQAKTQADYVPKPKIILDEPQQTFVKNNHKSMKPMEMAKTLWGDDISHLGQEVRAVAAFIKKLPSDEVDDTYGSDEIDEYKAVRQMSHVVYRVNKYASAGLDATKMNPKIRKDMQCLLRYMTTHRFLSQVETYPNKRDWELFESTFVRGTYDKNDLTQEEVDQYVVLAAESVAEQIIRRNQTNIQNQLDENTRNGDPLSKTMVDALSDFTRQLENNLKRQADLVKRLTGTREKRLESHQSRHASVSNLVEIWRDEKGREEILALNDKYKDAVGEEIQRLSGMDELKCKIMGISEEEVLNG